MRGLMKLLVLGVIAGMVKKEIPGMRRYLNMSKM